MSSSSSSSSSIDHCKNALELSSSSSSSMPRYSALFPRLNTSSSTSSSSDPQIYQLKYLNVGAGTTGTRSIYHLFCNKWKIKSFHFSVHCNPNHTSFTSGNKLLNWYNHVTKCSVNPKNRCSSHSVLQSLQQVLPTLLNEYEFLSDTPIDMLFIEIFAIMNFQVTVFATIREPNTWALRRVEEHPNTLICRRELWDKPTVFHPFDIIGCLLLTDKVENALTTLFELVYSKPWLPSYRPQRVFETFGRPHKAQLLPLSTAFTKMNSIHNEIVIWSSLYDKHIQERGRGIEWICLWNNFTKSHNSKLTTVSSEESASHNIHSVVIDRLQNDVVEWRNQRIRMMMKPVSRLLFENHDERTHSLRFVYDRMWDGFENYFLFTILLFIFFILSRKLQHNFIFR